ncbi:MAG: hypothetical protein HY438_02420 [DPANN group archaeon]|nr:hypothetical protein [DPANN group archaeon]
MAEKKRKKSKELSIPHIISINAIAAGKSFNEWEEKELIANTQQSLDALLKNSHLNFTFRQAIEYVCNSAPKDEQEKVAAIRGYLTATGIKKFKSFDMRLEANGMPVKLDDLIKQYFRPNNIKIDGEEVQIQALHIKIYKSYVM